MNRKRIQIPFINNLYKYRFLYLMVTPAIILVLTFSYIPLFGWVIAFKNYRVGQKLFSSEWVGLRFFKDFFITGSDWIYLLRNTLVMNISMLIVNMVCAVLFAILIYEIGNKYFSRFVQTVTFFPFFISWVIIYSLVYGLFAVSSGAINQSLVEWGIIDHGMNILGDAKYSWGLIILMVLWKTLGYNAIIFIAAISAISPEEYEAAIIDGANRFQKVIHITIPNLMPTFIVLLILNSGWILNSNFEMYYLFTNSTNWTKMEVLDVYIYEYGLQLGNYPYATAVGIVKSVVSIILLLIVNSIAKKTKGSAII